MGFPKVGCSFLSGSDRGQAQSPCIGRSEFLPLLPPESSLWGEDSNAEAHQQVALSGVSFIHYGSVYCRSGKFYFLKSTFYKVVLERTCVMKYEMS